MTNGKLIEDPVWTKNSTLLEGSKTINEWSGFTADSTLPIHSGKLSRFSAINMSAMHKGIGIYLRAFQIFYDKNKGRFWQHGRRENDTKNVSCWVALGK